MRNKTVKAWHFMRQSRKLRYGDGRKVVSGRWLSYAGGGLKMCRRGMHASRDIVDALYYAPGPIICRVELGGKIVYGLDKACAEKRRVLWWIDGTEVLYRFARMCALDVVHLWDAPEVVVKYLKTGDEKIRDAARNAARAAADAAAYAAHAAAYAAWDAVHAAHAADYAAGHAADAAAWVAAADAVAHAGDVDAHAAAWSAARDAARKKQARRLGILVHKAMRKKYNR